MDVFILSGFLGSGKTSALLNLLQQAKKMYTQPAVLMNEFGELNFDSEQIHTEVPIQEILSGCICCTGSEKTEAELQTLLVKHPTIDVLFIETTGAAHPVEALDAIHSPLFAQQLTIKGIITVVDVQGWLHREQYSPRIRSLFIEQIKHAHVLILNKVDLATEGEVANVIMGLNDCNPQAMVIQATQAKVDLQTLISLIEKANYQKQPVVSGAHLPLQSNVLTFTEPVSLELFEEWVRSLPETVYRIKGYVPIKGQRNPMIFQYAYGTAHWMPGEMHFTSQIVVIGERIEELPPLMATKSD